MVYGNNNERASSFPSVPFTNLNKSIIMETMSETFAWEAAFRWIDEGYFHFHNSSCGWWCNLWCSTTANIKMQNNCIMDSNCNNVSPQYLDHCEMLCCWTVHVLKPGHAYCGKLCFPVKVSLLIHLEHCMHCIREQAHSSNVIITYVECGEF